MRKCDVVGFVLFLFLFYNKLYMKITGHVRVIHKKCSFGCDFF